MARKVDHKARAHAELPPSSSDKWMNCFGWRTTVNQHYDAYGRPPSSAAAEEGTAAHEKFERHLLGLISTQGQEHVPEELNRELFVRAVRDTRPITEDDDEFDHLQECIEWIEKQPGSMLPETRLDFGEHLGYVGLTGTVDVTLVTEDTLTIADLKYGKVLVEVLARLGRPNTQLMCYLVGAINRFGPRERYRIVILQPRAWHKDGPIREHWVTKAELAIFLFDLENAIEASYKGGPCTPGPWCRHYCDALASCRAVVLAARQRLRDNPED